MPDYTHCFRKSFTQSLYLKLVNGNSINLVGPKFTGRQRLLDDIAALAQQDGYTAVVVDMNHWKHHYEGCVEHAQEQLLLAAPAAAAEEASKSIVPANHLSSALASQIALHKRIILLLNNFDAVLDNPRQRFPKTFFDDLNSLRHKPNLSLCVVSGKSHLQSYIYYKAENGDDLERTLSWLELEVVELERPTLSEVREELNKRLGDVSLWINESEKERFVTAVRDHAAFYRFMEIVCNSFRMNHAEMPAGKRLKRCFKSFRKNYKRRRKIPWGEYGEKGLTVLEHLSRILKNFFSP